MPLALPRAGVGKMIELIIDIRIIERTKRKSSVRILPDSTLLQTDGKVGLRGAPRAVNVMLLERSSEVWCCETMHRRSLLAIDLAALRQFVEALQW